MTLTDKDTVQLRSVYVCTCLHSFISIISSSLTMNSVVYDSVRAGILRVKFSLNLIQQEVLSFTVEHQLVPKKPPEC